MFRKGDRRHAAMHVRSLLTEVGPKIADMAEYDALISHAAAALRPRQIGDRWFGDVAATVETEDGSLYSGVAIDTTSGTGFCAEHSAIAAMITAGIPHPQDRRCLAG
jgi:hypothetical protein